MFDYSQMQREHLGLKTYYKPKVNWVLYVGAVGSLAFWAWTGYEIYRAVR